MRNLYKQELIRVKNKKMERYYLDRSPVSSCQRFTRESLITKYYKLIPIFCVYKSCSSIDCLAYFRRLTEVIDCEKNVTDVV